ncbi:MAG: tyrosine--tRNA ligase [Thermoplasmata archaeon]|nr:tyrosine--tRNA ligase [Thermoplasmata archaeon]
MDVESRTALVRRNSEEVLTLEELLALFARETRPKAYIGFEPSGRLHLGHLVTARKLRDLQEAGCDVTVFLADWHAWINDKLGGSLERIEAAGRYMEHAFAALGVDPANCRYRFAHELTGRAEYWARVVRVAKATTLARTKRAMTILGRGEEESQLDTAKLFYPSMQAADIFELPVDLAYAGLDQRRAHVLAREVAQHYGWPVPVALHTPLVSSLKGSGRMEMDDPVARKMSKSDPGGSITIPCDPAEVKARVNDAYCPARGVDGNPVVEITRYVIFPWLGSFEIDRPAKFGGPVQYDSEATFLSDWGNGKLHPQDLKTAVATSLGTILEPTNRYFAAHPTAVPADL